MPYYHLTFYLTRRLATDGFTVKQFHAGKTYCDERENTALRALRMGFAFNSLFMTPDEIAAELARFKAQQAGHANDNGWEAAHA